MKRNVDRYEYSCLNDAKDILVSIGMPENLTNPRSVMTLVALAEMTPDKKMEKCIRKLPRNSSYRRIY